MCTEFQLEGKATLTTEPSGANSGQWVKMPGSGEAGPAILCTGNGECRDREPSRQQPGFIVKSAVEPWKVVAGDVQHR